MNLIASVDENWGIGADGQLLARVPADMRQFRQHTLHHVVVLGRLTLATFPHAAPLPERTNIILSRNPAFACPDAYVAHSQEELFALLHGYADEEIYVIGGASVYRQLLPYCRRAYLTRFHAVYAADRFLPNLDAEAAWQLTACSERMRHAGLDFTFLTYENSRPLAY